MVRHIVLKVFRAVKCIRKYPETANSYYAEADILTNLRHPGIPIIYDIEENNDYFYIIEEFIDGMSLKSFISNNKSISTKTIIMLAVELCNILEHLHQNGIFHNDIKPANILIDDGHVKLLDYGNSVMSGIEPDLRMGTRKYAAPELYGKEQIEAVSDIYSVGVVLLYMATGSEHSENIPNIHPHKLQDIVSECVKHSKRERICSITLLKKRLLKISKGKSVSFSSKTINFAGVAAHQGTTHCAFMTFLKMQGRNHKTILCEKNDSGDFINIIKYSDKICFNGGIITADNVILLPDYKGYACENINTEYEYIINDYGVLTVDNAEEIMKGDAVCLVTGGRPYELNALERVWSIIAKEDKVKVLLNHTGTISYHKAVKKFEIYNPVRVPFCPEPK